MFSFDYSPAADLQQTVVQRWASARREPDILCHIARSAWAVALRASLATYHRMRIAGRENLPQAGSYVLVANHASHLDVLCLLSALPILRLDHTFPCAAADYFFSTPTAGAISGVFMNALPFSRSGQIRQTLRECRELLAQPGNILILFPEGTRSTTGEIGRFKTGVAELVAGTNTPVVPCYIHNAHKAWPKGAWVPRPRKLSLTIGAPLYFQDAARNHAGNAQIAYDLEQAVRQLAGQPPRQRSNENEHDHRNATHHNVPAASGN